MAPRPAFLPVSPVARFLPRHAISRRTPSAPSPRAPHPPRRLRCSARAARARETDARGFVVPEEGDVVLYQGRWADEDAAGLVESVRYVSARDAHVVDVLALRRVAADLFAISRGRARATSWLDVADVRVVSDAVYVPSQDAYRVVGARDGYAHVAPLDDDARARAADEYAALKRSMLVTTAAIGVACSAAAALVFGRQYALPFAYGAAGSLAYLAMLQAGVDAVGSPTPAARLLALRFAVPVLPFLVYSIQKVGAADISRLFGSVSRGEALALVLGLLVYKLPLLARTGNELVDGIAAIEIGKTGMVGTVASLAARQIKKQRDPAETTSTEDTPLAKPVFVFAGPSGVGKSTLIHRLMDAYPDTFDFSVSHTTRPRRDGEAEGIDYNFVSKETFERMIQEEQFVEHAQVHGFYYGTSYAAVEAVTKGAFCILDLDVQGVDALRAKKGLPWSPRFIWIAPPSIEALDERLRARGTETEQTLKTRLDTATRELSYAATHNVFDLIIINEDIDTACDALTAFVHAEVAPWQ